MGKSIFQAATRAELQQRLARLKPESAAKWGKMNAPKMVAHLADSSKMALGDLPVVSKKVIIRFPVIKHLIIYVMPWPKSTPTAPELVARAPAAWNGEIVTLSALIERFGTRSESEQWPPHPAFGAMSGRLWGALVYRHFNHHFTQFGV
jgi:hypothetical protein